MLPKLQFFLAEIEEIFEFKLALYVLIGDLIPQFVEVLVGK